MDASTIVTFCFGGVAVLGSLLLAAGWIRAEKQDGRGGTSIRLLPPLPIKGLQGSVPGSGGSDAGSGFLSFRPNLMAAPQPSGGGPPAPGHFPVPAAFLYTCLGVYTKLQLLPLVLAGLFDDVSYEVTWRKFGSALVLCVILALIGWRKVMQDVTEKMREAAGRAAGFLTFAIYFESGYFILSLLEDVQLGRLIEG